MVLYRGAGSGFAAKYDNLAKGSVIKDDGFISMSHDYSIAKQNKAFANQSRTGILMEIEVPKSSHVANISTYSDDPSEREYLGKRGTQFNVMSWSEKKRTLKLQML